MNLKTQDYTSNSCFNYNYILFSFFLNNSDINNNTFCFRTPGGMQDYNYFETGCFDVTMELGNCKYPLRDEIAEFWEENEKSLLQYLMQVHRGKQKHSEGQGNATHRQRPCWKIIIDREISILLYHYVRL